jgi:hypothetical protein
MPGVVGDTTTPSNSISTIELPAKPLPDAVTELPAGPLMLDRVMDGITLKVVVAVLPAASVAVMVCAPVTDLGIVNVAEKLPRGPVGTGLMVVVWPMPSYCIVMVELGAKPLPVTVTRLPTVPLLLERVMDGPKCSKRCLHIPRHCYTVIGRWVALFENGSLSRTSIRTCCFPAQIRRFSAGFSFEQ